jgi:hypothetical protein
MTSTKVSLLDISWSFNVIRFVRTNGAIMIVRMVGQVGRYRVVTQAVVCSKYYVIVELKIKCVLRLPIGSVM